MGFVQKPQPNPDWGMTVKDTSLPKPQLKISFQVQQLLIVLSLRLKAEKAIEGMLNGTITSLSDKWSSGQLGW